MTFDTFDRIKARSDSLPTDAERLKYLRREKARLKQERIRSYGISDAAAKVRQSPKGRLNRTPGDATYLGFDYALQLDELVSLVDTEIEAVHASAEAVSGGHLARIERMISRDRKARKKASSRGGSRPKMREGIYHFVCNILREAPSATNRKIVDSFPDSEDSASVLVGQVEYEVFRDGDRLVQVRNTPGPHANELRELAVGSLPRYIVLAKLDLRKK